MPGDPKECRQHAANCIRLASEARTKAARYKFDNLAVTWEMLAAELEAIEPFIKEMNDAKP